VIAERRIDEGDAGLIDEGDGVLIDEGDAVFNQCFMLVAQKR